MNGFLDPTLIHQKEEDSWGFLEYEKVHITMTSFSLGLLVVCDSS